jgi:uncharacterized membrane protein YeiB
MGANILLAGVAGKLVLLQRAWWARWLAPLAAVGHTALTNYVLQSVLITTIFYD